MIAQITCYLHSFGMINDDYEWFTSPLLLVPVLTNCTFPAPAQALALPVLQPYRCRTFAFRVVDQDSCWLKKLLLVSASSAIGKKHNLRARILIMILFSLNQSPILHRWTWEVMKRYFWSWSKNSGRSPPLFSLRCPSSSMSETCKIKISYWFKWPTCCSESDGPRPFARTAPAREPQLSFGIWHKTCWVLRSLETAEKWVFFLASNIIFEWILDWIFPEGPKGGQGSFLAITHHHLGFNAPKPEDAGNYWSFQTYTPVFPYEIHESQLLVVSASPLDECCSTTLHRPATLEEKVTA